MKIFSAGILALCFSGLAQADGVPEPYTSHFMVAMRHLHTSLRNPSTLSLIEVRAVKFTKTVCITYRAQNGFGGYSIERMAYIPTVGAVLTPENSSFKEEWHRYCEMYKTVDITAQALEDFPAAR